MSDILLANEHLLTNLRAPVRSEPVKQLNALQQMLEGHVGLCHIREDSHTTGHEREHNALWCVKYINIHMPFFLNQLRWSL